MSKFSLKRFTQCAVIVALLVLLILNIRIPLGILSLALSAAAPLLLGCVMAYILNLILVRFERIWFPKSQNKLVIRTRRGVCILLSILTLVVILLAIVQLALPELVSSLQLLTRDLPVALQAAMDWLVEHADQFPTLQQQLASLNLDWPSLVKQGIDFVIYGATDIFNTTVGILTALLNGVVTFVIGFIFALYLLFGKDRLFVQCGRVIQVLLKPAAQKKLSYVLDTLHETFSAFIVGQCTEAVILGTLCALGMTLLRLPYGMVVGVVIGFTALIPVAGAYIGGAVGAFLLLMISPMKALIFLIFLVILQQLEGNLIYPRVVGSSIGLPGLWVLATVTIGGGIAGIFGMLIGVPLAATLYKLFSQYIRVRERALSPSEPAAPPAEDTDGEASP